MRGRNATLLLGALLALASGCDDCGGRPAAEREGAEPEAPDPREAPEPEDPHAEEPPEPEERPLARVVSGWDRGMAIDTEPLELPADAEPLVLDLRDGARVTFEPGSRAVLGEEAPAQVILAEGAVHAQLPPMGGSTRPSLRIGTPAGTLTIEASGEAFVIAAPDGRVLFAQLSGLGRVYDGEADGEGRPVMIPLRPGRSLVGGAEEAAEGVGNVARARALREPFVSAGSDAPSAREPERRLRWLDAHADDVERERSRGQGIQRDRVLAAHEGDEARGAELQRELIAHSQVVSRQRQILRTRWERLRALALLHELEPDPTVERRPRARMLLGLAIPVPDIVDEDEATASEPEPGGE